MDWTTIEECLLKQFKDKPDDHVISIGDWTSRKRPTFGGEVVDVDDFVAYIKLTMGEIRGNKEPEVL